ncbi:unnamed protein product [Brassica napus]|uniref:(rape) hypothetical protein n=1 Tax=Brassica napus TaxID=3708 RepID=A0A816Y056_BRANA|nr:unnamed protein product [Brassica napus]
MSSSDTVLAQSGFDAVRCRKICGITLILLDEKVLQRTCFFLLDRYFIEKLMLTMILCRLLTYPHLQGTREARAHKIHWFVSVMNLYS